MLCLCHAMGIREKTWMGKGRGWFSSFEDVRLSATSGAEYGIGNLDMPNQRGCFCWHRLTVGTLLTNPCFDEFTCGYQSPFDALSMGCQVKRRDVRVVETLEARLLDGLKQNGVTHLIPPSSTWG